MEPTFEASGLFGDALETSPTGILIATPAATIVFVNRELERQFGYARADVIGQSVGRLVPDAPGLIREIHSGSEAAVVGRGRELAGRRKDGSTIPVELRLKPMRSGDDLIVIVSVVDLSERTRAEASQRAALEEQLGFHRFLADLSFQFINLPGDQVVDAIRTGLGQICQRLHVDRCSFFRITDQAELFDIATRTSPGVEPVHVFEDGKTRLPWTIDRVVSGAPVLFSTLDDIPSEIDRASFRKIGTKSAIYVPLSVSGRVVGAVGFSTIRAERHWPPEVHKRLELIASVFDQVLARLERDQALAAAVADVQRLQQRLQAENVYLRREEREHLGLTRIVGQSAAVRRVLDQIQQVAPTDATVLLLGETGTGKELFATQIHELSLRHARAMVRVNCGAIPATLIESELFGREKGAFTGALARQMGRFELADRSTIFLDEIGDIHPDVQVKLLRVLEERTVERLGSPHTITVDVRMIAATHRNLEQRVVEGSFREDLYYRLNVFPIRVPPLRERPEDIPLLIWRFVDEFNASFGKRVDALDKDNLAGLQQYPWPGNIRELRNAVERAMIVTASRRLTIPVPHSASATRRSSKLLDVEKDHIRSVLESAGWRIRGANGAADRLGLKPTTLETRMAKLGIRRPRTG